MKFVNKNVRIGSTLLTMAMVAQVAAAMEDTKVLPKGVRNVIVRSVNTEIDSTTNAAGEKQALGAPLEKGVTFNQLVGTRTGLDRAQSEAFLKQNGFAADEEIGQFTADLRGRVQVVAPVFSYGVSDRWTLALAVPVYSARTAVDVGFRTNSRGQDFLNVLSNPQNNNTAKAREAGAQMNNMIANLNTKLVANNYQELSDWSATALGDVTLLSKYRYLERGRVSSAFTSGVTLPTGRVDDPNILNDLGFGTGAVGMIAGVGFDEAIAGPFYFNQYAQYTAYLPSDRDLRLKTPDEQLEVQTGKVRVDLGDKLEYGVSLQADTELGLQGGVGLIFLNKAEDKIRAGDSRSALEANTAQSSQTGEAAFGYSSINAYKRGTASIPFTTLGTYRKQVRSTNMPVSDQIQLDMKVYF